MPRIKENNGEIICPATAFMRLFKAKWTVQILYQIMIGNNHYGKLLRSIPKINPRSLAIQLKHLEALHIIKKNTISEKPLQIAYSLTEDGEQLKEIFFDMRNWYNNNTQE